VVSIYFQLWLLPVLLTFHTFIGGWLKYFVGMPMHCGLRSNVPDFRKCVRTVTLDPISEFLYWHMNWHTEHHMYAGVPCYNLKKLHEAIAHDMPQPKNVFCAWREMRETWRKQQADPSYEYDTPVPPPADRQSIKEDAQLAASIGDLAPKSLA
jgi:fatty acid desaturase